eukprot:459855-Amphidinium_carterae.2
MWSGVRPTSRALRLNTDSLVAEINAGLSEMSVMCRGSYTRRSSWLVSGACWQCNRKRTTRWRTSSGVRFSQCTTRQREVKAQKSDSSLVTQSDANVSSDLRLDYALQRRGIAWPALSVKVHTELLQTLMSRYLADRIPGFASVTLEQLKRAANTFGHCSPSIPEAAH